MRELEQRVAAVEEERRRQADGVGGYEGTQFQRSDDHVDSVEGQSSGWWGAVAAGLPTAAGGGSPAGFHAPGSSAHSAGEGHWQVLLSFTVTSLQFVSFCIVVLMQAIH